MGKDRQDYTFAMSITYYPQCEGIKFDIERIFLPTADRHFDREDCQEFGRLFAELRTYTTRSTPPKMRFIDEMIRVEKDEKKREELATQKVVLEEEWIRLDAVLTALANNTWVKLRVGKSNESRTTWIKGLFLQYIKN